MPTPMKILFSGLTAIVVATILLFFAGFETAAMLSSYAGTGVLVFGILAYVVLVDSKRRWPQVPRAFDRLTYLITFGAPKGTR